jgi:hypothetical protein
LNCIALAGQRPAAARQIRHIKLIIKWVAMYDAIGNTTSKPNPHVSTTMPRLTIVKKSDAKMIFSHILATKSIIQLTFSPAARSHVSPAPNAAGVATTASKAISRMPIPTATVTPAPTMSSPPELPSAASASTAQTTNAAKKKNQIMNTTAPAKNAHSPRRRYSPIRLIWKSGYHAPFVASKPFSTSN